LAFADVAQAQRRVGGRGWDGSGGYYSDGYNSGWGWRGGYGYSPFYNGYYSGNFPIARSWFWSTPYSTWDWGATATTEGYYGDTSMNYGNAPAYSSYGGYSDDCGSYGYMGSSDGYYGGYADMNQGQFFGDTSYGAFDGQGQMNTRNTAAVRVFLPSPQARVAFEGQNTQQTGFDRLFISPELQSGQNYVYTVKATWMQNGQEISREKKVHVRAGQGVVVDFRRDTGGAIEAQSDCRLQACAANGNLNTAVSQALVASSNKGA
jgi:uncharacterized protein (TIGR03000 family)